MIAILGGLGAAVCWATATLCSSRSSRLMDPLVVVAWVMLVGILIAGPAALLSGIPTRLGSEAGWLAVAGIGNVSGLLLSYGAMRIGQVSLVAPLVSTEGAIAALIALLRGETVAASVAFTLAVIAGGICLASIPGDRSPETRDAHPEAVVLAVLAALSFGAGLYATGVAGSALPASWVVLAARLVGTVVLALPLALSGRLKLAPGTPRLLVVSGLGEVLGFYSYTLGARHGIAVAAVLSSQFAALAVLIAYLLFKERLGRIQLAGVAVVVTGVAVLSALRA
jgi:drug/metabolite transporter (DMT)-like permease